MESRGEIETGDEEREMRLDGWWVWDSTVRGEKDGGGSLGVGTEDERCMFPSRVC